MEWIDRQGSTNIQDQRSAMTAGSVGELMVQLDALDQSLTILENMAGGIPPLPRRRPLGREDTWAGQTRRASQVYGDEHAYPDGTVFIEPFYPMPRRDPRRYPPVGP